MNYAMVWILATFCVHYVHTAQINAPQNAIDQHEAFRTSPRTIKQHHYCPRAFDCDQLKKKMGLLVRKTKSFTANAFWHMRSFMDMVEEKLISFATAEDDDEHFMYDPATAQTPPQYEEEMATIFLAKEEAKEQPAQSGAADKSSEAAAQTTDESDDDEEYEFVQKQ